MKKLFLLLVVLSLIFVASCAKEKNNDATTTETGDNDSTLQDDSKQECTHSWSSATCTAPKTCSKCNEVMGEALGHTTDSGTCSRCGENFSSWETGEYKDEFGLPSGKKYMVVDAYGTFSNSATTNSTLLAAIQIDTSNIGIMLWEYGSYLVKGTYDYEHYDVTILDANGIKHYFTGTIYKGTTRVYFDDEDREKVLSLLKNNDSVKIYLKSTKYSISTYLFEISTKGFSETYSSITNVTNQEL